jgi:L-methionine (R)-S-oxide reductase
MTTKAKDMTSKIDLNDWLVAYLAEHHATAGTVHVVQDGGLRLAGAVNIPETVQQVIAWVPCGKGMAGLAFQLKKPVQTCNLQEDASGSVKPGAKAVNAKAAVALPVFTDAGIVCAVVGIAFDHEREFDDAQLRAFASSAAMLRPE